MSEIRKFLKMTELVSVVGKSRASIYAAIKDGAFPAPVRVGPRAVVWDSAEIAQWQNVRIAESKA
jgi:prophage regulatory protein